MNYLITRNKFRARALAWITTVDVFHLFECMNKKSTGEEEIMLVITLIEEINFRSMGRFSNYYLISTVGLQENECRIWIPGAELSY